MKVLNKTIFICITFSLISMSLGQKLKIRSVSGGLGVGVPEGKWGIGFSPEADIGLGEVLKDIHLHPFFSFWYNSYVQESMSFSLKQLLFGIKLIYYLDYKYEGPYLGAGISYHILYPDYSKRHSISQSLYKEESVESRVGLSALAGYIIEYKTIRPYTELKFYLIPGGYSSIQLLAGVLYRL
jgi:hypothetical protein